MSSKREEGAKNMYVMRGASNVEHQTLALEKGMWKNDQSSDESSSESEEPGDLRQVGCLRPKC